MKSPKFFPILAFSLPCVSLHLEELMARHASHGKIMTKWSTQCSTDSKHSIHVK
jgi:hypothetical protein